MEQRLTTIIADLENAEQFSGADLNRAARRSAWVADFSLPQLEEFFTAVSQLPMPFSAAGDRLLANWLVAAVQARRKAAGQVGSASADAIAPLLKSLEDLYRGLGQESRARGQLLAWLSSGGSAAELALFDSPPEPNPVAGTP